MNIRLTPPVLVGLTGDLEAIETLKKQWRRIPYAANSQAIAAEAKKTLELFNNPQLQKPSILAHLPPQEVKSNLTIQLIDNAYNNAISAYRTDLINASAADFATSLNPRYTALDFHHALVIGAARFAAKTPDIPVLKYIIGPFLSFIGSLYGMIRQNSITAETIAEERSEHRTRWFEEVQIKEKVRVESALSLINRRVSKLKKDLDEIGELVDQKTLNELRLLDLFVRTLFPEKALKVDGQPLLEYINSKA